MKKKCCSRNVINFLKKGITLSLLILLNLAAYSNPMGKNTERKAGYNFLSVNPAFTSFDHDLKNNPLEEASKAARTVTYCSDANPTTAERSGTITVAGQTHTVTQKGAVAACSYMLEPAQGNIGSAASTAETRGSFSVAATGSDCTSSLSVTSNVSWITPSSKQTAASSWTVTYSYLSNTTTVERRGTITVSGHTYTVTQAGTTATPSSSCSYTLAPSESRIGSAASTAETRGSFSVAATGTDCTSSLSVTSNVSWITPSSQQTAASSWTVTYSYLSNTTTVERRGTITVSGHTYTVTQKGAVAACSYTLEPAQGNIGSAASTAETRGRFSVAATGTDCTSSLSVTSNVSWITPSSKQTAASSWTVTYSYLSNTTTVERSGTITVSGHTYTVTQAGTTATPSSCSYTLVPSESRIGSAASTAETRGSFSVAATGTDCTSSLSVTSNVSWITPSSQQTSASSWTVTYSYLSNTTTVERRGTITVSGQTYTVTQAGTTATPSSSCSYTLAPSESRIGSAASTAETEGRFSVAATGTDCTSSLSVTSNVSWITPSSQQTSASSWTVTYSYLSNTTTVERRGTITVSGHTYTVTQAGTTATPSSSCSYTLAPTEAHIGAAASTDETKGRFSVAATGTDCTSSLSVTSNVSWITPSSKQTAASSWTVTYSYLSNTTTVERSGTITVSGHTYTVTQAGTTATPSSSCSYTLAPSESRIGSAASTAETEGRFSVVATGTDCTSSLSVTSNVSWITPSSKQTAASSWTVTYSYLSNTTTVERSGTITVGDKTYTVTQAGTGTTPTCSYTLSPMEATIGSAASTESTKGSFSVTVEGADCSLMPSSSNVWITNITKAATANADGSWTVTYSYMANTNTAERSGTITVGDKTYTVTQAGTGTTPTCSYTLSPMEANIGSAASTEATKGSFSVTVQGTDCTWTPEAGNVWINNVTKVTPANADGSWTVTYTYMANTNTAERSGTISVGDKTYTVIQAGGATCSITLSRSTGSVPAEEGTDAFLVLSNGDACEWTAAVAQDATWLTIDEGQIMIGIADVYYSYTTNPSTTPRTGIITVAGHEYTVTQAGTTTTPTTCSYTLSPMEANIGSSASTESTKGSFSVTVEGADCSLMPSSSNVWITNITKAATANADGSWTVTYSYMANTNTAERSGTITVGDKTYTITQAGTGTTPTCSYTLSPMEANIGSAASTESTKGSFSVTVEGTDCPLRPSSSNVWITNITKAATANADGSWTVTYSYMANTNTAERSGTIAVGDKTYTVTQAGTGTTPTCSYMLSPMEANIGFAASTESTKGSFSVTVEGADCSLMPSSSNVWITNITKAATANADGSWTVTYSYMANTNTAERSGTITVGDKTYTVTQAGTGTTPTCSYTLSPMEANIGSAASTEATKGSFSVTVQGTDCTWTPEAGNVWINNVTKVTPANADGSWTVTYTYMANTNTAERSGTISVGDKTYTVIQAGGATCSITLSRSTGSVPAEEGTDAFLVLSNGDACEWTAAVAQDATWLTIDEGQIMIGIADVYYSYTTNPSTTPRTGIIAVAGHEYTVTQAGTTTTPTTCSYTLSPMEANIGSSASTESTKGSFSVTIEGADCSLMPSSSNVWITNITKAATANADGSWTVTYSYMANTNTAERSGTITVGDKTYTVTQAGTGTTPTCSYTLSPMEANIGSSASTESTKGSFSVTVEGADCSLMPSSSNVWITNITKAATANADGSWTVTYSYLANTATVERSGTITVSDQTHTVIQAGTATACSYTLSPIEANRGSVASTAETLGSFSVTVQGADCTWTPSTTADWITNVSKASTANADGSWTVTYSYLANTATVERRGTITVSGQTHTVIQAGTATACSYTLSPIEANRGSVASTAETVGSFSVTVQGADCTWTPSTTADWITNVSKASTANADGSWTVTYSYLANTATVERRGTITVSDQTHTVIQAGTATACSYTLSPIEANRGSVASTAETLGSFSVTVQGADCTWTPSTTADWITNVSKASTANADGSWTVTYSYLSNTTTVERRGSITVSGQTHTVIQAGTAMACSYTLSPIEANRDSVASTAETLGSFSVTVQGADCTWTPSTTADWITNVSKASTANADGSWTVTYSYLSNTTTVERRGSITVSGQTHTVIQAGTAMACSYTLSPIEANRGSVASTAETLGSFSVTVQGADCTWTPSTTADWITNVSKASTANADGSWTVTYSYLANTATVERRGTITVSGQTHTVIQAGTAMACSYTLSPIEANRGSVASTAETLGSFSVTVQGADCTWTPSTTADWITNVSKASTANADGSWTVTYSYLSNTTTVERRGTITVSDQIHTVIQAGTATACSYTLSPIEANRGSVASTAETLGSFSVTVQGADCTWTPSTTADWITNVSKASTANADGSWTVTYSYLANTATVERRGAITVSSQTHTVIQAGTATACSYTLSPIEANRGSVASTAETAGSFSVTVQGADCTWTPSTTADWITNVSKASTANADGSWTVTYSYLANTATVERRGAITVSGQTHTVIQAGAPCLLSLSSATANVPAAAGTGSVGVVTNGDECTWTATVATGAAEWLSVLEGEGQALLASTNLTYSYKANPNTTPRTGTITVAGQIYTVTQAGAACLISLPATTASVPDAAGTGSVSVVASGGNCSWTVESKAAWITIPVGQTLLGSKNLNYSYEANTSATSRTGTITVAGQTFTVTQSALVTGIEPSGDVRIFPNPAKDFVTVDLSADKIKYASLKIVNQVGQIIYQLDTPPAQALQIPLNGFGSGMYFIFLQGEEKVLVKKLIVR